MQASTYTFKVTTSYRWFYIFYSSQTCQSMCIFDIKQDLVLNKIEGWSRDGSAKKYTNKVCRDMLAFLDN